MSDVFSLAEEETSLHKVAVNEDAGPCPKVLWDGSLSGTIQSREGNVELHVSVLLGCRAVLSEKGRKRGWGDAIDYLRHYRGMSFQEAKALVDGQEEKTKRREPISHAL